MDENKDVLVHDSEELPIEKSTEERASRTELPLTEEDLYASFVPKSRVTNIVKEQRALVADKIRREMQELHAQELEKLRASQANSAPSEEQSPQIQEVVSQLVAQEIAKIQEQEQERIRQLEIERNKEEINKGMRNYSKKMEVAIAKDPELAELMKDYDLEAFPYAAYLAGQMDDTHEIMKELARNPTKAKDVNDMALSSGKTAIKMIEKISKSIAKNQEALENNIQTNAPLSRLKSSNVGADSGKMSLKDFKNADYNRV